MTLKSHLVVLIIVLISFSSFSKDIYIPKELKPWAKWVEEKHPQINCVKTPDGSNTVCAWSGVLKISANKKGLAFSQAITVLAEGYSALPGNSNYWPKKVKGNGKNVPVISLNGNPTVYLKKGTYNIEGNIEWNRIPESFQIPTETALINLSLNDKKIKQVNRDSSGKIWFGTNEKVKELKPQADHTDVRVFRKIIDGEPIKIESHLNISISGKPRELLLGKYLPDNSAPLSLESALPARIEKDGNLRIQVKPGTYSIILKSRQLNHNDTISFSKRVVPWPEEEVWSFQSNNNIRVVNVTGSSRLDPSQTSMPNHWRNLPAFLVKLNDKLILKEEHRGDWAPTPDALSLSRTLWLDFNGEGYTVQDIINGTISQSSRLTSEKDFTPGTVTLNNQPQLITETESNDIGIEVKQGNINLAAVGRYKGIRKLSLSGWKHSFNSVNTRFNLPPGWKFIYAGGVDRVESSWVGAWNLWDIFFMLIIVVSIAKLMGTPWGIIAFFTLLLTFHEKDAPIYSWITITVLSALLKVLPENKFRRIINVCMYLTLVFIASVIVTFSIFNIRKTIYPQLEHSHQQQLERARSGYKTGGGGRPLAYGIPQEAEMDAIKSSTPNTHKKKVGKGSYQRKSSVNIQRAYDVNAKIQTGPGIPSWNWNQFHINHSGPVEPGQKMSLYLTPPIVSRLLNILNCLLLLTLLYGFIKQNIPEVSNKLKMKNLLSGSSVTASLFLLLFTFPQNSSAQFPSESILKDLENRLTAEPPCGKNCAEMSDGLIIVKNDIITIDLTINAIDKTSFYLPGSTTGWRPDEVLINGNSNPKLYAQNQKMAIVLKAGTNKIKLKGSLSDSKTDIPFHFRVHNLKTKISGWTINGIKRGTLPGNSISLEKIEQIKVKKSEEKKLLPDPAPTFCHIERRVHFDKEWIVYTTVRRIAPERGSISLKIPLLKNEAILTGGITSKNDSAAILIPDRTNSINWQSRYKKSDKMTFTAPNTNSWSEEWIISSSTMWHIETEGLTPIKSNQQNNRQSWLPRPGETLFIKITRPKAIEGPTKTFESVKITHTPGKKSSESIMSLSVKSSRGDKTKIKLPKGSDLEKVIIDGSEKVISHQDGVLDIPLHPGKQKIDIHWKEKSGIKTIWSTPVPKLNSEVTNIALELKVPYNRWPIFITGPKIGPAMLIWGILIVLIIVALILSKTGYTILKSWQWILLFLGMSTVNNLGGAFIIIWFILFSWRDKYKKEISDKNFNTLQVLLVVLTIISIVSVAATVPFGLLSTPNMQITGNGSSRFMLNWYQDMAKNDLPKGWLISLPIWSYRVVMLLWSLWLATALPSWLKWAWGIYSKDGLWRKIERPDIVLPKKKVEKKENKGE